MSDALGYYKILEVTPQEDTAVIKRKYYEKAKYWHPDHNESANALDIFQKISAAYDLLKDEDNRLTYDLLSEIYTAKNFPQIGSLKIYKNQGNKDDKSLRVLKQQRSVGGRIKQRKDICNFHEAGNMVLKSSIYNWLLGWWGKGGLANNTKVIRFNMQSVNADDEDNFQLLLHNALAYKQENNVEMAWVYAKQALLIVPNNPYRCKLLNDFIAKLNYHPQKKIAVTYWNPKELRYFQYLFPAFLLIIAVCVALAGLIRSGVFDKQPVLPKTYYEERIIGGYIMPSDMVEAKIMKNDSSMYSTEHLVHLKHDALIYYGPDTRYSVLLRGTEGQTLRVSGYTYDKKWYQVVIDSGEQGYVKDTDIAKGAGLPVKPNSKVYRGK